MELAAYFPDIDVHGTTVLTEHGEIHADIPVPSLRVVVEIDGHRWHCTPAAQARDIWRNERLAGAGWRVLRVREAPLQPIAPTDVIVPVMRIRAVTEAVVHALNRNFGAPVTTTPRDRSRE